MDRLLPSSASSASGLSSDRRGRRQARPQLLAGFAALSLLTVPAFAQQADRAGTTSYRPEFFASSQPTTAYDMVQLTPGFHLEEGDPEVRGYSGSGGNVLIDGQRPASKEQTLEELLKAIPARAVDHIEVVRSSASGLDMQGHATLVNVVRSRTGRLSGRIEGEYATFRHGFSDFRAGGTLTFQSGDTLAELRAARYRDIDDEHGFGSRNRYSDAGDPLRLTDYAQPEGTSYTEIAASYRQHLLSGTLRAAGLFKSSQMFADIRYDIMYPAPALIVGSEHNNTRATEGEVQYDRDLASTLQLELLAVRRDERLHGVDTSTGADLAEVNATDTRSSETILRGVVRRSGTLLSLEVGAEGARNVLDSHVALTENDVPVALPAADVRVAEDRGEVFLTGTWRPVSPLTIETGARYEVSRLSQSGDSALTKSLAYFKPRLFVSYSASPVDLFRITVEREVGQLNFEDFVSAPSLTGGTITAGNKNLEPDSLIRYEAAWERQLGKGSIVLAARHEAVSNAVDRVVVSTPQGDFDSAGNIGSATRDELEANLNLPLDPFGLPGLTAKGNVVLRHSGVMDPLIGEKRRISGNLPVEADGSLTYDLPRLGLRTGVNYIYRTTSTIYKIDEIERDILANRLDAFVEYKGMPHWTFRLFARNITNSPQTRIRYVNLGLRGLSPVDFREVRTLRSGSYLGLNVQWTFGE